MTSLCSRCRNLHLEEHILSNSTPLRVGDILELKEAVHTVVYTRILREAAEGTRRAGQSSDTPVPWNEPDYSSLKARPAVVMELPGQREGGRPKVCLLATFRGTSVRAWLPDVLQYFCAAVHLHDMIAQEPQYYHAHTRPEWTAERSGRPNGWLIACSFRSKGLIQGRWKNRQRANPDSNSSFTVGTGDEYMELETVCDEKWKYWQHVCARNREAYRTFKEDYERWRADHYYRARNLTPNTSLPSEVSNESRDMKKDSTASTSPAGKGKGKDRDTKKASTSSTSANRFAAVADLSSMDETGSDSSASTISPASDTSEPGSVNSGNMGEMVASTATGDGQTEKKRTFKGLAKLAASISRVSTKK